MAIGSLRRATNRIAAATAVCFLGSALNLAPVHVFDAAQAQVATQTQTLQARSFVMPAGAAPTSAPPAARDLPRPRIPIGDAALAQVKSLPGGARPEAATAAARTPQPEAVSTNCVTNDATGYTPSDIHGAAGPTNIITVTNVDIGVYNKTTCAVVSRVGLRTLFASVEGGVAGNETLFDPQVLYDPAVGRFLVTTESCIGSCDNSVVPQNQFFAVSKDNTGTSWWLYKIVINDGTNTFCISATTTFWDYPHVGSMNGSNPRWMITANVFPAPPGSVTSALLTIPKTATLTGASVTPGCFTNLAFNVAPANVLDSSDTAYLLSPGSGSSSSITRYAFTPGSTISNDTITTTSAISIASWSAAPNAPQPNGNTLDSLDGRFVSQTIQNGTSLWNVHAVNVGGFARGRLYQFSTTGTSALFTKDLSTAANDYIFNVSVATNATQAFVSASRTWPSQGAPTGNAAMLIFNGPKSSSTGWIFNLIATSTSQYTGCSPCRWGDNSATQIDPSNNNNAWGFNQLVTGTNEFFNWNTRGALEAPGGTICSALVDTHDFNDDCKSDILWRNTNGDVAIWLMDGGTVQSAIAVGNMPTSWTIVGTGDFNGDGKGDILWQDSSGNVAIWLMNGTTIQSAASLFNVGTSWTVADTGDFNGDGKWDILWRDTGGRVAIWLMNGTTIQSAAFLFNVGTSWTVARTGDFNGDGTWDILWRDTSGNLAIWLMNGTTIRSAASLFNVGPSWMVAGTGDFNGDGRSDILWRDSTGNVAIWFMNGTTIQSGVLVGNVPTSWQIQGANAD